MGKCPFSFMHAITSRNNNEDSHTPNLEHEHQTKRTEDFFILLRVMTNSMSK